jgi:uncharacterized protein
LITAGTKPRVRLKRLVAVSARWLHIYLSMASFTVVFFFAATGLTLNHPDWFTSKEKTSESHGVFDKAILADKLAVVESMRARDHVHGAVTDFRVDDSQVSVSFRAPGYTADAFIDRTTGKYDLTVVQNGFVAVMNDLHKGRDSGKAWSAVIDISAVLLVLVSLTGLVLIWFVYRRRKSGLALAAAVTVGFFVLWHYVVTA